MHLLRIPAILVPLFLCAAAPGETLIRFEKRQLETRFHGEGVAFADLNKDGRNDVIYGPFWWEGPDFQIRHRLYDGGEFSINGYSDNFFVYTPDLNGDGWPDVLVLGFPGKEARWYENPGQSAAATSAWKMHVVLETVDNESPTFTDITGDGKPEIVCSQGGRFGYASPAADPTQKWTFVPVTEDVKVQKFTHGLGVGDVNGDGKMDLLEARRWWEQKDGGWLPRTFQLTGAGGAQMFAYDFNGDGANDVVSSLNAHQFGLAWFENKAGGDDGPAWEKHVIVGQEPWENDHGVRFSQPHALAVADVDGDGVSDIITGKRYWAHNGHDPNETDPRVIYWFQTKRGPGGKVEFVPHLLDDDSGVGTQLTVGDVNGDGLVDVVIGNKAGCHLLLQRREEVSAARFAQFQPKKIYGPEAVTTDKYAAGQPAADATRNMILPAGFKADLIASEPELVQPIAMCWDARGRLWVVEGNTYPEPAPEGQGRDRVLIFEDADGNGTFESRKVFIEKLNLVSGIETGFGGVWIGAAPHLLFIPDRNGDDKPDGPPEVLLDGWGHQDTHETLNSFIWGPDGWLYGCHGVFTHSKVGKPGAAEQDRIPLNAGVWRYHPVRRVFEVFAEGTSNPWGLDFDERGEFFVTACVIPHLYHILPGGRYQRQAGQHFNIHTYDDIKTIAEHRHYAGEVRDHAHWGDRKSQRNLAVPGSTDQAGGGHAHCGLAIYQGDNFPAVYRGALIFGNLHGHRLVHDAVERRMSGYTGQRRADFLRANDHWFIPVTQKVGPDGALYVSDWYDEQTCHHRDPAIWNRGNGRIYRVAYDEVDLSWRKHPPADAGILALAEMLVGSSNSWHWRMALRLLMERAQAGDPAMPLAKELLLKEMPGTAGAPRKLRALWGLHAIDAAGTPVLAGLMKAPEEEMRGWAVRLLGARTLSGDESTVVREALARMAREEKSALVRRELASLLQRLPLAQRAGIAKGLLAHQEDAGDPNIPLLVWYGIEPLVAADGQAGLALAEACRWEKVSEYIYRRMAAADGGREVILQAISRKTAAAEREKLLALLVNSARGGGRLVRPASWQELAGNLRQAASPALLSLLDELGAYFGEAESLARFREILVHATLPPEARKRALQVLVQAGDEETAPLLHGLITGKDTALVRHALQALASLPHPATAAVLVAAYPDLPPFAKPDAVATLASTEAGARALLSAVDAGVVAREALSPFLARQLQALKSREVDALIAKVWGTVNAGKADLPQRKAKYKALLTPERLKTADLAQGKLIYAGTCGTCHQLFGEGVHVGPDLTGSNRGALDYLLDNVLDPNAIIGKDYQLNLFSMNDGRVLGGIVREETAEVCKVVMPGGVEFSLAKSDIKSRELSKLSTMPEGQFDAMPPEMVVNLVAYLQSNVSAPVAARAGDGEATKAVEGALEGESLKVIEIKGGKVRPQGMGRFGGQWSRGSQLWWTGASPGDTLTLGVPVAKAGRYGLKAVLTRARDYGVVEITLDGEPVTQGMVDLFDPSVIPTAELDWGVRELGAGEHRLVIKITGSNPAAVPGRMFGLDYVRLEPLKEKDPQVRP